MSVVGASTQIAGRVGGEGGLRVEGRVGGDVEVSGPIEIAAGGSIEGDVSGGSLEISGRLAGDASCQGPIAIRAGAEVRGDLKGSSVSVDPGAKVDVRLDTDFKLDFER